MEYFLLSAIPGGSALATALAGLLTYGLHKIPSRFLSGIHFTFVAIRRRAAYSCGDSTGFTPISLSQHIQLIRFPFMVKIIMALNYQGAL